jgi:cytochrome b involved in lipid metabolism
VAEVSLHAASGDCWYVLYGDVYDLTGYANQHPGGAQRIYGLCGTDATAVFQTIPNHNPSLLAQFATPFRLGPVCG